MASKWILLTDKEMGEIQHKFNTNGTEYVGHDKRLVEYQKIARSVYQKIERARTRIKISSAKGKGRGLQMWVCERIALMIGLPFKNQDDQCLIHCREMGQAGKDVILRGEAKKRFPFSIECKSTESLNIVSTIAQVKANTEKDEEWLIVHKRRALPMPIVMMAWTTFEKLFRDKSRKFLFENELKEENE